MRREIFEGFVLTLLGITVSYVTLTGKYSDYVTGGFGSYLFTTGLLILLLGLWKFVPENSHTSTKPKKIEGREGGDLAQVNGNSWSDENSESVHLTGYTNHGLGVTWLLIIPTLVLLIGSPGALNSYYANTRTYVNPEPSKSIPYEEYFTMEQPEIPLDVYTNIALWSTNPELLDGKTLQLVGFTAPNNDGGWDLIRFKVGCCAADAYPIRVKVDGNLPNNLPPDTWVKVTGKHDPESSRFPGESVTNMEPQFLVDTVEVVQKPNDVYL